MIKLDTTSCNWALEHLKNENDTDLFPRPFEIDALARNPQDTLALLASIDIGSYQWVGGRNVIVPKEMVSFRTATQLDPIDSLVLSAIIRQFGINIEQRRIPPKDNMIFSYRFQPTSDGHLYNRASGWNQFWQRSLEKAQDNMWIVIADVAGYYNQVYHHSVEQELQSSQVPQEVVAAIIRLLKKLTQGVSRGIPIGPHSIHLLAESVFDPIDKSLLGRGYTFCRFVDDIHIFCKTQEEAFTALFDLAEILGKQQRLELQRHKTMVVPADSFSQRANRMIIETPLTDFEKDIIAVIDKHSGGDKYKYVEFSSLSSEDLNTLSQSNLEQLLDSYLAQQEPNYPRIRWLFRRLAQVGVPGAVSFAIGRIKELIPALADMGQYLVSVQHNFSGDWESLGNDILQAIHLPIIQHSEYLTAILLDLYARLPFLDQVKPILQMYPRSSPMARRKIVRVATEHKADYWLREQKESLPVTDPWLKRALIASASAFGKDEREYWLRRIDKEASPLEKIVVRWVRIDKEDSEAPNNRFRPDLP